MTGKNDIKSLIRKFVEDKASADEIELLQEYFKTSMGMKSLEEVIDEYAEDFDKPHLTPSGKQDPLKVMRAKSRFLPSTRVTRAVAATFLGLILLTGGYVYFQANAHTVYKTMAGQRTTITLPDSTVVTLNGNSSLSFRGNWKDEQLRSVDLSGEAYFEVMPDPAKPFVVNTSGISIKVLGTTFNVKSYDNDDDVETTLVEGKVAIEKSLEKRAQSAKIELSPAQKATFNKDSKEILVKEVDVKSEVAWISGSLIFEDEPFSEIIKDLERWYGIKITVKDTSSLQCRFSTTIEGESLDEVLQLFSLTGEANYRFQGDNQVWIEGSLCDQ